MTNASSGILVDSNVLIYVYDPRDHEKQAQAALVVDRLITANLAVLSVQCLTEFFNVATRKLPEPLSPAEGLARVTRLASSCQVFGLTPAEVLEGCRGAIQHRISFWDALIWAVAKLNQISYVLTEDMQHGLFLEGVRFQNPFVSEFDLRQLAAI